MRMKETQHSSHSLTRLITLSFTSPHSPCHTRLATLSLLITSPHSSPLGSPSPHSCLLGSTTSRTDTEYTSSVLSRISIKMPFVLSQSEFPLKFYKENKQDVVFS
uniref:Uncharacterized protein n=2 Tax=Brassica campestris TaxID=3711 RepID=A0A3P5Z2B1_BRACM|nr:unnamed protein product [Brassica rapa]